MVLVAVTILVVNLDVYCICYSVMSISSLVQWGIRSKLQYLPAIISTWIIYYSSVQFLLAAACFLYKVLACNTKHLII